MFSKCFLIFIVIAKSVHSYKWFERTKIEKVSLCSISFLWEWSINHTSWMIEEKRETFKCVLVRWPFLDEFIFMRVFYCCCACCLLKTVAKFVAKIWKKRFSKNYSLKKSKNSCLFTFVMTQINPYQKPFLIFNSITLLKPFTDSKIYQNIYQISVEIFQSHFNFKSMYHFQTWCYSYRKYFYMPYIILPLNQFFYL